MVDLNATSQALMNREHLARLEKSTSPIAQAVAEMGDFYVAFGESLGFAGADLHDPLAVGMAFDKTLATDLRPMHIDVETKGELTYGATVANRYLLLERTGDAGDHDTIVAFPTVRPNAEVPLEVDGDRFVEMFLERLTAPPRSVQ
jgi:inosine-uridine nucleoside N-ribohydrolase